MMRCPHCATKDTIRYVDEKVEHKYYSVNENGETGEYTGSDSDIDGYYECWACGEKLSKWPSEIDWEWYDDND
jgi:Zn ribbon nucleic-acid-binding protein